MCTTASLLHPSIPYASTCRFSALFPSSFLGNGVQHALHTLRWLVAFLWLLIYASIFHNWWMLLSFTAHFFLPLSSCRPYTLACQWLSSFARRSHCAASISAAPATRPTLACHPPSNCFHTSLHKIKIDYFLPFAERSTC